MNNTFKYIMKIVLLGFGVIPFGFSLFCILPLSLNLYDNIIFWISIIIYFSVAAFSAVIVIENEYPNNLVIRYIPVCLPLIITLIIYAYYIMESSGFTTDGVLYALILTEFAFVPAIIAMTVSGYYESTFSIPLIYQTAFLLFFILRQRRTKNRPAISKSFVAGLMTLVLTLSIAANIAAGYTHALRMQTAPPKDYGFKYGGGFASVDIHRYDVLNDENILPVLDKPSSFIIGDKNKMPVLDGAEAAYPVYSAFANACYEGIAEKPQNSYDDDGNDGNDGNDGSDSNDGSDNSSDAETVDKNNAVAKPKSLAAEKITFTNTIYAFERLVEGKVDIFFGAQPSEAQKELAQQAGKNLVLTPIGKDAFVFFVSNTNECNDISTQSIHDIYSGSIKNWRTITGKDKKIIAFQRPENSGSQTIMKKIMGDIPLIEPLREEYIQDMGGVVEEIAN